MGGPLSRFTDAVVEKLVEVEEAEASYVEALGGWRGRLIGSVVAVHPTLLHPAFNLAVSLDAQGQDVTAFARRLDEAFRQSAGTYQIVCSPLSQPSDIEYLLCMRGFLKLSERLWMEQVAQPPTDPEDSRLVVGPPRDGTQWARVCSEGLGAPLALPLLEELARRTASAETHALFVARWEDWLAGAVELSVDGGIAVIRRLAVLEEYRARPVARALVAAACERAYELDCYRALTRVFNGHAAQAVLESLGFAGTHVSQDLVRSYPDFLLD